MKTDYVAYAVQLRRILHKHPEIGFDLPKTLELVRRELDRCGISFTEEYGRSSIVGTINPEMTGFTIGLRADMDALPIQEETGLSFSSEHAGCMHACGHDIHTAILLAAAKQLQDNREKLRCRVKLLFTPAEEYTTPGCKEMAEAGVMDDIDCIIALHVDPSLGVGKIYLDAGGQGANSLGFTAEFFGKSAHVLKQEEGRDAISMAVMAYTAMEKIIAKELPASAPCVLNIGSFHGGHTNNIICDYAKLFGTIRTHSDEINDYVFSRVRDICDSMAAIGGGHAKVNIAKFLPHVVNHPVITECLHRAAANVIGEDNICHRERTMAGEDFSFLCRVKPGAQYWVGSRSEAPQTGLPLHNSGVIFDEECINVGLEIMVRFVFDNMYGIDFGKEDVQ